MATLEVITGCMFSGKTERLRDRIHREMFRYEHTEASPKVLLFKPSLDTRYTGESKVVSHNNAMLPCLTAAFAEDILAVLEEKPCIRVVGIDEIQFLDGKIVDLCRELTMKRDIMVIASGLNLSFRGEPFPFRTSERHMGELLAYAQLIRSLTAYCAYKRHAGERRCGKDAYFTQRLFPDGEPVPYGDDLIIVGGKDVVQERRYEARCLGHHYVPGRP
ncbi:thymidine kinase [Candidatus Woesearchaeota archaeon]|nr:thymidine kinase [Candidatus Woesearchaeota archaeon]